IESTALMNPPAGIECELELFPPLWARWLRMHDHWLFERASRVRVAQPKPVSGTTQYLAKLRNLRHLVVDGFGFGDAELAAANLSPTLAVLEMRACPVTDDSARVIERLPNLDYLFIRSNWINDVSLDAFARMPKLKQLDLSGTKVSNEGVA